MKKKLLILGVSVLMLSACAKQPAATTTETTPTTENVMDTDTAAGDAIAPAESGAPETTTTEGTKGAVKEFKVSGDDFTFDTTEMKVNVGDTVRVTFTNAEGMHDWVLDEFKARTKILKAGTSETIEFVADKAGTYEYYCSVGQHRKMGMKGNLIVE